MSESVTEEIPVDFRMVDITKIQPNNWNPNQMQSQYFDALSAAVKDSGMQQPILVREVGKGKFEIVDGEHRYRAATLAGMDELAVVVVDISDLEAQISTLAYNNLRGQSVPLKLAQMLVDLQKEYSDEEIRVLTGIATEEQKSVMQLLNVPEFDPFDKTLSANTMAVDIPIGVHLYLAPNEHTSYFEAMTKAMKLMGADVTPLIGKEVEDYNKAMDMSMGLLGMKMRNVALATLCQVFLRMNEDDRAALVKAVVPPMVDEKVAQGGAARSRTRVSDEG